MGWYNWIARRYPDPGSGNYAFVPGFTLPSYPAIGGPGKLTQRQLCPIQPPQRYQYQNIPLAGYGGLQAGQIALQGLLVPPGQ